MRKNGGVTLTNFNKSEYITIISERQKVVISVSSILYIIMEGKSAEIHLSDGKIYNTRMTFTALEEMLGDGFIKAHRGCIVSAMAIHEISDMIDLVNGEKLNDRFFYQRSCHRIHHFRHSNSCYRCINAQKRQIKPT